MKTARHLIYVIALTFASGLGVSCYTVLHQPEERVKVVKRTVPETDDVTVVDEAEQIVDEEATADAETGETYDEGEDAVDETWIDESGNVKHVYHHIVYDYDNFNAWNWGYYPAWRPVYAYYDPWYGYQPYYDGWSFGIQVGYYHHWGPSYGWYNPTILMPYPIWEPWPWDYGWYHHGYYGYYGPSYAYYGGDGYNGGHHGRSYTPRDFEKRQRIGAARTPRTEIAGTNDHQVEKPGTIPAATKATPSNRTPRTSRVAAGSTGSAAPKAAADTRTTRTTRSTRKSSDEKGTQTAKREPKSRTPRSNEKKQVTDSRTSGKEDSDAPKVAGRDDSRSSKKTPVARKPANGGERTSGRTTRTGSYGSKPQSRPAPKVASGGSSGSSRPPSGSSVNRGGSSGSSGGSSGGGSRGSGGGGSSSGSSRGSSGSSGRGGSRTPN